MNENVNAKPYLFQQLKALDVEKIHSLLSNYDTHKNAHVERKVDRLLLHKKISQQRL
jgi:hypothetical protein